MSMIIDSSLTTRDALQVWLADWHKTADSLNARLMADKFLASDIESQYGNFPILNGKEAVQASFNAAFQGLDHMHHEIEYFDFVAPDHLYQAVTIDYVVKGDDHNTDMITIPAIWSAWLVEEDARLKVKKSKIYLDASKVFARMSEKGLIK